MLSCDGSVDSDKLIGEVYLFYEFVFVSLFHYFLLRSY